VSEEEQCMLENRVDMLEEYIAEMAELLHDTIEIIEERYDH
jgi:hypothetical protein